MIETAATSVGAAANSETSERLQLLNRIYWCLLNTKVFPFTNKKLRQAFSIALDRNELASMIPHGVPAFSPLSSNHAHFFYCGTPEGEPSLAVQLFEEALQELRLDRSTFPILKFIYRNTDKMKKLIEKIRDQWERRFGIEIQTQSYPWPHLFQRIVQGDYEISSFSWLPWINDPLYTLYTFHPDEDQLNMIKWKSPEFQQALEEAVHERNRECRAHHFAKAEAILVKEVPVIPFVAEKNQAIKRKTLKIELNHEFADFKTATFVK